jgi:hypothetical protein
MKSNFSNLNNNVLAKKGAKMQQGQFLVLPGISDRTL